MLFHIVFLGMPLIFIDITAWDLANFLRLVGIFAANRQYLICEMFDVEFKNSQMIINIQYVLVFLGALTYIYLLCHSDVKSEIRAKRGLKVFFLHM